MSGSYAAKSGFDSVLNIMSGKYSHHFTSDEKKEVEQKFKHGNRAWGIFMSTFELFLIGLKQEPARIGEAFQVLHDLVYRIYNEDFRSGKVDAAEIETFLTARTKRIVQILPPGAEGEKVMEMIVTLRTMTTTVHEPANTWGTDILVEVNKDKVAE